MNAKTLVTGYYRPTESFKSIEEHIAVCFENMNLVAIVGPSDDDPDNLKETMEYAELFAQAPLTRERLSNAQATIERLADALEFALAYPRWNGLEWEKTMDAARALLAEIRGKHA